VAVTLTRTFELRALLQTSRPSVCPADEDLRDYSLTLNRLIGLRLRTFDVVPSGCGAQRLSHVDYLLLFTFLHFLIAAKRMGYRFREVEGVVFRLRMKLVATHSLDGLVADIMPSIDASVSLRFSMEACCNSFYK